MKQMNYSKRKRAILHIDMDTFFCSVERLRDPSLEGIPLIVGGNPNQRGVVATASYEAREFGIHSAMPLKEAARLCPHAVFVPPHFDAYLYYSRLILDILERYSPLVEPSGIDEAYVDLTGSQTALGKPAEVAQRMRKDIREKLGLPSSAGLSTSKIVSKIASDIAKPDGFLEVSPGEERQFLASLPVEKLPGVGDSSKSVLYNMGVQTIGDLSLIPPEVLEGKFGFQGRILAEHAKGIDRRAVEVKGKPKSVSREV
ncbi:MAG: DNA polymerase IV, partial [Actinomycetota bacterium]|nr:DNA polymerase IV [Actinomycetota bacterium]